MRRWTDLKAGGVFWVGAHRGGCDLGPENTLETAALGYGTGAHFWELDVQLSKDDVPVVIHDDTLERTTNAHVVYPGRKPWRVRDFLWEEIQPLCPRAPERNSHFQGLRTPFGERAGTRGETPGPPSSLRIPTLREALAFSWARSWPINVEIKGSPDHHDLLVRETARLIADLEMHALTLVSSFHCDVLHRLKALDPRILTGVLTEEAVDDPKALLRALNADTLHLADGKISESIVRRCWAASIPLIAWTVNDPQRLRQLKAWGVSAVITDRPQALVPMIPP
ncbi:glycerophosphodiester phosphodiesterase [Desulfosoma sp.]